MKRFFKDWKVKSICLLAAMGLWVYVAASQNTVGVFPGDIKIQTLNSPSNLVAIYKEQTVNIKIIAEPSIWKTLSADSFSAYIDLSGLSEGNHQVPVTVTASVPGVQIVEKNPETIMVSLEPIIQKEIKINTKIEGSAAQGMIASSIALSPDTVLVKGAKSAVSSVNEASVAIKLNGESQQFEKNLPIKLLDINGNSISGLNVSPSESKAIVAISQASNIKTVGIKVKTTGETSEGYRVSGIVTDPALVDITGALSSLNTTSFIETYPVDLNGLTSDSEVKVNLNVSGDIYLVDSNKNSVTVKISIVQDDIERTISPEINFLNLNTEYTISSYDPTIAKVTVSGASTVINSLDNNSLPLNIDLKNVILSKSKETLNMTISKSNFALPDGVSLINFSPTSINIVLQKK